jgi:hypothetical protein
MESGVVDTILGMLIHQYPAIVGVLTILGTLVVLGQVVVVLTPSKSDEEAYSKLMSTPILGVILMALSKFSVIQKK